MKWWWQRPIHPLMQAYCQTPRPSRNWDYRDVSYVALDFETTGLNAKHDQILSLGWVVIHGNRIALATAEHHVIRIDRAIPPTSAVIHQITDDQAARGELLTSALEALLPVLAGRVLIAHYADIERDFLRMACRRLYHKRLPLPYIIDTQLLAQARLERHHIVYMASDLRLYALAARYHLPRLMAHHALNDALLTAELFLALVAHYDPNQRLALKHLLS